MKISTKPFLARFDFDTEVLQDLTSSKEKLRRALEGLACTLVDFKVCERMEVRWLGAGGRGDPVAGNTTLYDAVYLASDEIMRRQEGRKAEVLLTDGVDHGSSETIGSAIEQAQRADTLIYSILFDGEEGGVFDRIGGKAGDGRKVLQKMSHETGGGYLKCRANRYRRNLQEHRVQPVQHRLYTGPAAHWRCIPHHQPENPAQGDGGAGAPGLLSVLVIAKTQCASGGEKENWQALDVRRLDALISAETADFASRISVRLR